MTRFTGVLSATLFMSPLLCVLTLAPAAAQELRPGVHRTPDERFADLDDFPFEPHYIEIDGLRMHYVDEGTGEAGDSLPWPAGGIWRCKQPRTLTEPRDVPWTWVGLGNIMTLQALHRSSGPPHGLMPEGGN